MIERNNVPMAHQRAETGAAPDKPLTEPGLSHVFNEVLDGFLQYLKLARNASVHTVRAYRADITQFLGYIESQPDLGSGGLYRVDRAHVRALLTEMQQGDYKRSSLARKLASFRAFCRWAKKQGYIENDPTVGILTIKQEERLPEFLRLPEVEHLLAAPDTATPDGLRDKALMELL